MKKIKQRTWLVKYVENWKKEKNYETPSPEFQREHGERKLIIVIIGRGFYSKFKLNTFRIFFFPSFTGIKKKKKIDGEIRASCMQRRSNAGEGGGR